MNLTIDDLPPTTSRILADKALMRTCGQECVDWAFAMLEQSHDDESLCVLACMSPPYNHFEMAELRDKALFSLNLGDIQRPEALRMYAKETMKAALTAGKDLGAALSILRDLYYEGDSLLELQDFYLLYYAYMDLQDSEDQHYWQAATRDNIDEIVLQRFTAYLNTDSAKVEGPQRTLSKWISCLNYVCKWLKIK